MSSVSEAAQTKTDAARDLCTAQELLGSYALSAQLAAGHLTTLHRAHVAGSDAGASLVVKRLHYSFVHEQADRELLLAAGRAGMRVRSSNVIRVLSVHEDPEPFLVMEHVPGVTLGTLLAEIEEEEALRFVLPVLVDVLQGLEVLHGLRSADGAASSLVHGAPSARHVLIGEDGVARLFDLTHAIGTGFSVTARRSLRLSPAEMAPEQVLAPMHVDARCDLFIVGTVLWRALTGQPLFEHAQREEALSQLLRKPILAPSEAGSVAGKRFDRICLRALARARAERYASAAEMARELKAEAERAGLFASREEIASLVRTLAAANHEADQENEVLLVARIDARGAARERNDDVSPALRSELARDESVNAVAPNSAASGDNADLLDILTLHHQGSSRFGFERALDALRAAPAPESPKHTRALSGSDGATRTSTPDVSELPARDELRSARESGTWYEGLPSIFPSREQPRTTAPFWLWGVAAAAALIGSVLIDNPPWHTAARTPLRESERAQRRDETSVAAAAAPGFAAYFEPAQQSRASSALPPREAKSAPVACTPSSEQKAEPAPAPRAPTELVHTASEPSERLAPRAQPKRYLSPLPPNPY